MSKNIGEWRKLEIGRRERKPQIYISRGKSKYIRFNPTLMSMYSLQDKKSVDVFIMEGEKKFHIAFKFRDDDKGVLTLSKNKKTGTGYISATSLFNEIGLDNRRIKENSFPLESAETPIGKALVLKLSKKLLD